MLLFLTCRLNCGKANTYNVEQSESMRDGRMTVTQELNGRDNTPPEPEDGTEAQDSEKGIYPDFTLSECLFNSIADIN